MRKRKRLPADLLAPHIWPIPPEYRAGWGTRGAGSIRHPRIDWAALFGNARPVEMEVGFGKGLFLVDSARRRPDVNFFGVEIIPKFHLMVAARLATLGLSNVRVSCGDAKLLLRDFVSNGSLAAIHVFFPDPWWKAKHKKRTLFTEEFADLAVAALQPGGKLHFVTDVEDYYLMVQTILTGIPALTKLADPKENTPQHDMDYLTNFVGSSRVDLQACKLEYSIVSPK